MGDGRMIRISIDMWPGGDERRAYPMHVIEIWNDLDASVLSGGKYGDYKYRVSRKVKGRSLSWVRGGVVRGFNRRNLNSVHLLRAVLNDAYGDKP